MAKCNIVLLDEVSCLINGLSKEHNLFFYEKYGLFAKGHFFSPKFQLGSWDGKIRFFHKTGKTYINLLSDIVPVLAELKYDIEINDHRTSLSITPPLIDEDFFSHITNPETNEPWKFRDYQVDSINAGISNSGGILIAATGAGKTSVCAALAYAYELEANFRSIIIVPDTTLTDQTKEEYEIFGLDVGEYSGSNKDLDHQHVVATWQTLKNNPHIIAEFNMLICDEVQGARGPVLNDLLVNHGKNVSYRFGCTGTLPEEEADAMSVRIAIGEVQHEVPASLLIELGHLAVPDIDIIQMNVDLTEQYAEYEVDYALYIKDTKDKPPAPKKTYKQFKNSYFPDFPSEKKYLQTEQKRLDWMANYVESFRLLGKGNTLVLVNGVAFGKKMAKLVPNSVFLHGKDENAVRKEIYKSFKDNDDLIVFATVNIAGTGLNIKRVFNLILVDIGKSFIRVIQAIGRGLRKAHDKDSVYIGDVCSDLKYNKKHLKKREQYYDEANYPNKKRVVDY